MIVAGIYVDGGQGAEWRLAKAVDLSESVEEERVEVADIYQRDTLVVELVDEAILPGIFVGTREDVYDDPRVYGATFYPLGSSDYTWRL